MDRQTGWICHLSMTHKVAIAYEGRNKVPTERIRSEFSNKRSLTPTERQKRLKPLNDLFSMAECALVADVVQTFIEKDIPYHPPSVVNDVLKVIGETHMSFEFHRAVKKNPALYLVEIPGMKDVLDGLKSSGKNLLLVSNSPYWYVSAGMEYILGDTWRDYFQCVVAEAGKVRTGAKDGRLEQSDSNGSPDLMTNKSSRTRFARAPSLLAASVLH